MSACMEFPKDWKDFLASYSFVDREEIYTNKAELIPCFRVEQLIEHYFPTYQKCYCNTCENLEKNDNLYICRYDDVGYNFEQINNIEYCPKCGRRLLTYEEKRQKSRSNNEKTL